MIDFDLPDEPGTGSPDASAGVPAQNFSVAYSGEIVAPEGGTYTLSLDTEGQAEVALDGNPVVTRQAGARGSASASAVLVANRTYAVTVRYAHAAGPASLHVAWSGPSFQARPLLPATHPAGL